MFECTRDGYTLRAGAAGPHTPHTDNGLRRRASYTRIDAAGRLGVTSRGGETQIAVVERPGLTLVFVRLDKTGKVEVRR